MPYTNTKGIGKKRTAAPSCYALFVALALGIAYAIQLKDLNLGSYMRIDNQSNDISLDNSEEHGQFNEQYVNQKYQSSETLSGHSEEQHNRFNVSSVNYSSEPRITLSHNEKVSFEQTPPLRKQSPACHPHFQVASSNTTWPWSNVQKFKRLYFYHARKAGGTSMANYLVKVAHHHGLEFVHAEWIEAEEPGTHDVPTFYVTHLREPIARSISHFKYQGRWSCMHQLIKMKTNDFVPTEDNAKKLESWNATGGHVSLTCGSRKFKLGECAVNCYTQWYSGLSCPQRNTSTMEQYQVARARLLRYNIIIVLEMLGDPDYVAAVENFFGVPGVAKKRFAACERLSRGANKMNPLFITNETIERLTKLNEVDIGLYKELTNCWGGDKGKNYGFPKFDPARFDDVLVRVPYHRYDQWKAEQKGKKP